MRLTLVCVGMAGESGPFMKLEWLSRTPQPAGASDRAILDPAVDSGKKAGLDGGRTDEECVQLETTGERLGDISIHNIGIIHWKSAVGIALAISTCCACQPQPNSKLK